MTLFWPELPTESAQRNLRNALHHLRRVIPTVNGEGEKDDVPFVLADRWTIQINPDGRFQLDVTLFEKLTISPKVADWEKAITLYHDSFLSDFYLPNSPDFEDWAQVRRADLRRRFLNTLVKLASHALDKADFAQAEHYARQQLAIDNLREEAHRQLMLVLVQNGRRTDALTHYQTLYQLLQDELGISPSLEIEALVDTIYSDNWKKEAEVKSQKPIPHNLPPQLTPFVGREAELMQLQDLLAQPDVHLITILGPGGIGKTRLALALAEQILSKQDGDKAHPYQHGVCFASLAQLGTADSLLAALAEAVRFSFRDSQDQKEQLLRYLSNRSMLLLLDNFEHLLDGSGLVGRLLLTAPQLQILVTSRERLRLQGEQVYPLQGLLVDVTAVTDDARTLFLQAARRLRPDFAITAENLSALNHICQLVGGMPLALELAAAWVDLLTLPEIAAEIQRNLEFLESDLRDVPSRHCSMQAVFDASWQRLSPAEQQLLTQVTIFKGGFTREAATAVTQASLRNLAGLVNKSLLTFDTANGRYHIHELLRQYAAKREENDTLHDHHSAYYCSWLVAQLDGLSGAEQTAVALQVQTDMPNIRAALSHTAQSAQFANLKSALLALNEYYHVCGRFQEGIDLFQQIHARLAHQLEQPPFALFWTSIQLANFLTILDQTALAKPFLQQAKSLLETSGFHQQDTLAERAFLYHAEGYLLCEKEPEAAMQLFRQSQTLLEQLGNRVWLIRNLTGLVRAIRNTGDLELAMEVAWQSFELAQLLANPLLEIESRLLLGNSNNIAGKYAEAEAQFQEVIAQVRQLNHPHLLGLSLIYLGFSQFANGHFEASLKTGQECQQVATEMGNLRRQTEGQILKARSRLHLGQYEQCAVIVQELHSLAQTVPEKLNDFARGILFQSSSRLALIRGDLVEARTQLMAGQKFINKSAFGLGLGLVATLEGEVVMAWQNIRPGIQFESKQKHPHLLAQLLAVAAYLYAVEGKAEKAVMMDAVARHYPFIANSQWFEDVIGKRITAVATILSPQAIATAQAKGQTLDMWQTAESLLHTLPEL